MAKKSKSKAKLAIAPEFAVAPKFDVEEIGARLRFINVEELVQGIFDAIDEAKGMAGALGPDECDEARAELEQLRKTVVFVFGASR
jgi:hypothetical protein